MTGRTNAISPAGGGYEISFNLSSNPTSLFINGISVDVQNPQPMTFMAGEIISVIVRSDFYGTVTTESGTVVPIEQEYGRTNLISPKAPTVPEHYSGFTMPNENCVYAV